ncbi:MAG: NIL domain-containing protein [Planctomycetota bacterium]
MSSPHKADQAAKAAATAATAASLIPPHPAARRIFLTFNGAQVEQPVVYTIGRKFNVVTNIRGASITSDFGIMALELNGAEQDIDAAVAYIESLGIQTMTIDSDD